VKIGSIYESVRSLNTVKERKDGEHPQRERRDQQNPQKDKSFAETLEVTRESVDSAVEEFDSERATQANGLHAHREGDGPGLRVVLKDGSGAVVRQLTGEEFLKLREAASLETQPRGKILDRKL
jgi:hypothetical protein